MDDFSPCFKTKSALSDHLAVRYVSGLLSQTQRKNMERMDERLDWDADLAQDSYQALQQFLSSSPWDERALYAQVAQRANQRLGGSANACLVIDEEANAKKGRASVGVNRQWNGRLGKEDNCQVGVFSVLNNGVHTAIVGGRLFLPEEWIEDPERCRKAGVPEERIEQGHRTKIDHARELIEEALANKVEFGCVAMDSFYGRDTKLRRFMEEVGVTYCVDVPSNTRVFERRPTGDERPEKISAVTVTVAELSAKLRANRRHKIQNIALRTGDAGVVTAQVQAVRVWEWSAGESEPKELWLVIRHMPDGSTKHSMCNANAKTSLKRLARWQGARFWVERCFQDAKSHCGLAQYQARGWRAWHHHMALVSLAILFTMEERLLNPLPVSELTCADIVELMEWVLISKPSAGELLGRIERRHEKRRRAAASALRRQRKRAKVAAPTVSSS
jgi:SRSO17 transposase